MPLSIGKATEDAQSGSITTPLSMSGLNHVAIVIVESANNYNDAVPTLTPENGNVFALLGSVGVGTSGGATSTKLSVFWCRLNNLASPADSLNITASSKILAQVIDVAGHALTVAPLVIASNSDGTSQSTVSFSAGSTTRPSGTVLYLISTSRDSNGNDFSGSSVSSPSITITDLITLSSSVSDGGGLDSFYSDVITSAGSAGTFDSVNTGNGAHAFIAIELQSTDADGIPTYGNSGGAGPLMMMLLTENG